MKTIDVYLSEKGISKDVFEGYSAEEKAAKFNELNAENVKSFNELKDAEGENSKAIAEMSKALIAIKDEQLKNLNEALKEQGVVLTKLQKGETANVSQESLKGILEGKKAELATLKGSSSGMNNVKIELKAAGDMSFTDNVTGQVPQAYRIPGFNDLPQRETRLLDLPVKATLESNLIDWVYEANEDGTAGPTGEGQLKNQIDFDLLVDSEKVQKITAFITITDELLDDPSQMESKIRTKLTEKLLQAVEEGYYSGNGTTNLNGLRNIATAFDPGTFATGAANEVENANIVDVIVVAKNQIQLANQSMPTAIIMSPTDVAVMKTVKVSTTDRRYVERVLVSGNSLSIDGTPVVVSNLVAPGEYVVGDFNLSTLWTRQALTIEIGYNADNFVKNFKTIRAEWRGAAVVETNDRGAFVAGDFATDTEAITAA
jgi:HK97 family phage major capsid protein